MSWPDFWDLFVGKAGGALWLDRVSADSNLDFFVGFSSLTAAIGSPGQANYAAANGFVDGVVGSRIAQGKPSLSIQWGPWADIGMAARLGETAKRRIEYSGLEFLQPKQAAAALTAVWQGHSSPVLIAGGSGDRLVGRVAAEAARATVSAARTQAGTNLRALPPPQRQQSLAQLIRKQVAGSLCSPEEAVSFDRPLAELGLSSLMVIDLSHTFSVSFGVDVPLSRLLEGPPINQLAEELAARLGEGGLNGQSMGDVLLRAGQQGGPTLLCVHAVGGDLDAYRDLVGKLPDQFTVSGVKAPGLRSLNANSPEHLEAIAAEHFHRVLAKKPTGKIHLCGWSLGGVIALEMARLFRARNLPLGAVILLDSFSPFLMPDLEAQPPAVLASVASDLGIILGKELEVPTEELAAVEPGRRTAYVFDRATREGLLPREPKHFQVFRANLAAMLRYVPTVDDSRVEIVHSELAARTTNTDTCTGWRRWLPRATYHPVQGDHYSMMQGANAMQIVDIISRAVESS